MKSCSCESEIMTDGSGRLSRYDRALDSSGTPVDGRTTSDLLLFAKRYASQVRFHHPSGDACDTDDSWRQTFVCDTAVLAASIAHCNVDQIQKDYRETRAHFETTKSVNAYKALFAPIVGIAARLDKWLSRCPNDFSLSGDVQLAIRSSMRNQMLRVFELDKAAVLVNSEELGIEFEPENESLWDLDVTVPFLPALYEGNTLEEKLWTASMTVDSIFYTSLGTLEQIVQKGKTYFNEAVEQYPKHEPHVALFICFLQLIALLREQMNGLTERHLSFYYRDVLKLKGKPAQPDRVNLVFELAKDAALCHIPQGTALSAGNDADGKDQVYRTDRDMVISKAKVAEIKNVFVDQCGKGTIRGFYARPHANTADGHGAPLPEARPWWNPMAADEVVSHNICGGVIRHEGVNYARVGFAIASPQLRLEGGNRLVALRIKGMSRILKSTSDFYLRFSSAEGWLDVTDAQPETEAVAFASSSQQIFGSKPTYRIDRTDPDRILVGLPATAPSISGYDAAIHGDDNFTTNLPVMQIVLAPKRLSVSSEDWESLVADFRNETVTGPNGESESVPGFALDVRVSGLKSLILQNEQGVQPVDNPLFPFTPIPMPGSPFYIGSEEAFGKPLESLSVTPVWQSGKQPFEKIQYDVLWDKSWVPLESFLDSSFENTRSVRSATSFSEFDGKVKNGFLRMTYAGNAPENAADLMRLGNLSKINELSISYRSTLTSTDPAFDQIFHLYPFGSTAIAVDPNPEAVRSIAASWGARMEEPANGVWTGNRLLPDFKAGPSQVAIPDGLETNLTAKQWESIKAFGADKQVPSFRDTAGLRAAKGKRPTVDSLRFGDTDQYFAGKRQQGNLYIGLESLQTPSNLSLLFQVAEGTAIKDDADPPAIRWSYLSRNQWKPFPDAAILDDATYGLQTTGIILFDLPEDASNDNTVLTPGLHWLCASVDGDSERLPFLIDIVAQAISATFEDQDNTGAHYQNAIPAGKITRFLEKPAEIKKVEQPFATYGGEVAEVGAEFYMRISERLKHKNRAITARDYEKLTLEYFPEIFKVKCITHTDPNCLCRDNAPAIPCGNTELTITFNPNRQAQVQGVVQETSGSPLSNISVTIKGADTSVTSDVSGNFNISVPNETAVLVFQAPGFVSQEVTLTKTPGRSQVVMQEDPALTDCCGPQVAPGHVLIVPITDLKHRYATNALQPFTSYRVLKQIEKTLKAKASPFVKVHAKNPVYEELLTAFRVQFRHGLDKGFYLNQLNEDLKKHLTPWAYDGAVDVVFGNRIFASSVVHFIEKLPYVDFITDFMLYQVTCDCCGFDHLVDEVKRTASRAADIAADLEAESPDGVDLLEVGKKLNAENHPAWFLLKQPEALWKYLEAESETMVEWLIRNVLYWFQIAAEPTLQNATNRFEQALILKVVAWYASLVKQLGLHSIDDLLKNLPVFKMTTVATPSTSRSLLVSAQQHIIMLYEPEPASDPCESTAPVLSTHRTNKAVNP